MEPIAAPPALSLADRFLRACDLPALIADDDGRGRVVAIRQFVKDWATSDPDRRREMVCDAPRRRRWWHRFNDRRFDLARIAAVVAALCDRDGVPVPAWAGLSRASRPITLTQSAFPATPWNDHIRSEAPASCAWHNVWFREVDLDDHRVHGFR